jgi:hypothetical protein
MLPSVLLYTPLPVFATKLVKLVAYQKNLPLRCVPDFIYVANAGLEFLILPQDHYCFRRYCC